MLRLIPALAVLFFNPISGVDQDNRVMRLRDVNTVYVAELGSTDKAKALRQEIIRTLSASKRVRLVAAPDLADAVLNLDVKQTTKNKDWTYESFGNHEMRTGTKVVPTAEIRVRLDSHQNQTLWAGKFDSETFYGNDERQAARHLASSVSRKFLKAVETDRKKRQ